MNRIQLHRLARTHTRPEPFSSHHVRHASGLTRPRRGSRAGVLRSTWTPALQARVGARGRRATSQADDRTAPGWPELFDRFAPIRAHPAIDRVPAELPAEPASWRRIDHWVCLQSLMRPRGSRRGSSTGACGARRAPTGCSALGVRARARAALPRLPPAPTLPPDAVPGVPGDARPGAHLHAAPPPRSRRDRRRGAPGQGDRTWVTVASRPRWACLLPPSAAGSDASAVGPPSCGRWPPSWRTATTASWSDRRSGKPDRRRRRSTRRSRRSRRPPVRHGPVALAGDLRVGRHADALALTTAVVVIAIIDLSRRHLDVQGRRRDGRHAPRLDVHLDCRLVIKTSGAQHPARTPPTRRCC